MAGFLGAFYVQGMNEKDRACMSSFNTIYPPDTPLMQFIGRVDKDGKEIFEGDILDGEDSPMVVSYNKKYASFCIDKKGWAFSHYFGEALNSEDVRVIGNIYENPESLS